MSEDTRTDAGEAKAEMITVAESEDAKTGAAESGIDNTAVEVERLTVAGSASDNTTEDARTGAAEVEKVIVAESDKSEKTDGEILKTDKKGNKSNFSSTAIFSILIAVAIVVSIIFYSMMRRVRKKTWTDQFNAEAEKMKFYTGRNVDEAFASLKGLSVMTTSVVKGLAEEKEYPPGFINIPDLSQTLDEARYRSGSLMIAYMPKVLNENLELWESYSRTHSSWIVEEQPDGPMNFTHGMFEYIWEFTDYDWENDRKRRLIKKIRDSTPGLRGNEPNRELETNRVVERPGDCSGKDEKHRRDLYDANGDEKIHLPYRDDDIDDDELLDVLVGDDDDALFPSAQIPANPRADFYTPVWQLYPLPVLDEMDPFVEIINYDLSDRIVFKNAVEWIEISKKPVLLDVCNQAAWFLVDEHRDILQTAITYPVFEDFSAERTVVGYYTAIIPWTEFFRSDYSNRIDMMIVVTNSCGEVFSVRIKDNSVEILGEYDAHDREFDEYERHFTFAEMYNMAVTQNSEMKEEICLYDMFIYPTESSFL